MRKRSKLNLSSFHNCTMKMGHLYPVNLIEVLPGDTLQINASVFLRLAPMVAPVMHPVYMGVYHFFIPSRVAGNEIGFDFESFITGGQDGADTQTLPKIVLNASNSPVGSLADAFGIPVQMLSGGSNTFSVNTLPFVSYYMIWNEYFRDQDLQTEFDYSTLSGTPSSLPLLHPCWSKDCFTTSRPWPQKGPDVTIPIDLSAGSDPVLSFTGNLRSADILGDGVPSFVSNSATSLNSDASFIRDSSVPTDINYKLGDSSNDTLAKWHDPALRVANQAVDGTVTYNAGSLGTGAISVNDVREAFSIQRFEEHRAMFGSRYEDYLRYLGVRPQDARLQLPEYLGGFTAPVQFSEVLQTSADSTGGVGDLYGHGIGAGRGRRIRRFIPEHGYIISVMLVRPISVYAQGLERLWSKTTRLDFWQKELEHIGQQEVLNSEVYADGSSADSTTFGYQNRYDEYRRGVNIVTGEFRTNQDFWTMARIFANRPALNSDFVTCNPTDRIFQVGEQNSDQVYCMVKNNVVARRLISKNGNPI